MSDEQKVVVGRIVHHVSRDTHECTAGIVTKVFPPDEEGLRLDSVSLSTFPWSDGIDSCDSYECQDKLIPGTWHWPQGCPR
jgi:hypothetical protein